MVSTIPEQVIYLTPSDVLEYLYCPRFTFFELVMKIPEHEELRWKVQEGRELHHEKVNRNSDYLRKKLGVVDKKIDILMQSSKLHLKGQVDEVLFLLDGTAAPLDYKFAEWKEIVFKGHKIQSILYGMLIAENFGKLVNRGYIIYTRSKNLLKEVIFQEKDFNQALDILNDLFDVVQNEKYPKRTSWRQKCVDCCYKNICV